MILELPVGHSQKKCCPCFAVSQGSPLFTFLSLAHHPLNDVTQLGLNRGETLVSFAVPFDGPSGVRVKLPVVGFSHPPLWYADPSAGSLLPQFVDPTLLSGNPMLITGLNSPWRKSSLAGLSPRAVYGCSPIGEKRRSYVRPSTHQRQFSCYRFRC